MSVGPFSKDRDWLPPHRLVLLCSVMFPPLCSNVAKRDFCSSFRQALDLVSWTRMSHISCICLCWKHRTEVCELPTQAEQLIINRPDEGESDEGLQIK